MNFSEHAGASPSDNDASSATRRMSERACESEGQVSARPSGVEMLRSGLNASLRSGIGATAGLVMLLGLYNVSSGREFLISLAFTAIVSYSLFEPISSRVSGHSPPYGLPRDQGLRQHFGLLARVAVVAILAVTADELFVKGIAAMTSDTESTISFGANLSRGKLTLSILAGIFCICTLVTLSWAIGMQAIALRKKALSSSIGFFAGALASAGYFLFPSQPDWSIFDVLPWPPEVIYQIVAAHVVLIALIGATGGIVMATQRSSFRRMLGIAFGFGVVTGLWVTAVYWIFQSRYAGLIPLEVFEFHLFVIIGWGLGLLAGPLSE